MTAPAQDQAQNSPLPGEYFDVPGFPGGATQWTEQDDNTANQPFTIQAQSVQPITGILPMRQTDVVLDWTACLNVQQTYTAGTSTLTASAYAPFNAVGPIKLVIQNQYASVDVESGIDAAIFDMIRPYSTAEQVSGVNNGYNPGGSPVGGTAGAGYPQAATQQANNIYAGGWTSAATSYNLLFRLPAGMWFDRYYDLDVQGAPITAPHPAHVSPQYMAGTTRVITPAISMNPGNAASTDLGPVNIGAGTGTFTGTGTLRIRRRAIYAGNPATQPPIYAWQYRRKTTRFGVGGQSQYSFPVPLDTGQLLSIYMRGFDPAAAGGLGAPINVNTITRANLQYGSGLYEFDAESSGNVTAAELWQRKWLETHDVLLPVGVLARDLATDNRGQISNARALNTLTTAGIVFFMRWTAPLSASAYYVMGTESLVYVV